MLIKLYFFWKVYNLTQQFLHVGLLHTCTIPPVCYATPSMPVCCFCVINLNTVQHSYFRKGVSFTTDSLYVYVNTLYPAVPDVRG